MTTSCRCSTSSRSAGDAEVPDLGRSARTALADYGGISRASVGVLLRSLITLEESGADAFFGEPEFDVKDLIRVNGSGKTIISVLELCRRAWTNPGCSARSCCGCWPSSITPCPRLATCRQTEAVLLFRRGAPAVRRRIDALWTRSNRRRRLIRSKGVGVYFVTQVPATSGLGAGPAWQSHSACAAGIHAARCRQPAQDRADISDVAVLRRRSNHEPGIGEAFVTVLTPKGVPTALAATRLVPPDCLFGALDAPTFQGLVAAGSLRPKYGTPIDRQSAYEIITARIQAAQAAAQVGAPAGYPAGPTGVPTGAPGAPGQVTMSQADYQRAVREQAHEMEQQQRAAQQAALATKREETQILRTGTRLITSKAGQDVIRRVFGTLFGKH